MRALVTICLLPAVAYLALLYCTPALLGHLAQRAHDRNALAGQAGAPARQTQNQQPQRVASCRLWVHEDTTNGQAYLVRQVGDWPAQRCRLHRSKASLPQCQHLSCSEPLE